MIIISVQVLAIVSSNDSRNVLVGDNNNVKISDFGLSRALAKDDSYYKLSQSSKLPAKWMALESLLYKKFSTFSDGKPGNTCRTKIQKLQFILCCDTVVSGSVKL